MSLLREVVAYLERRGVASALVGGAALALHGIARATEDFDLLAIDSAPLDLFFWRDWPGPAPREVRRGDAEDPIAGLVAWTSGETKVDLVVGKDPWMRAVLERRVWMSVVGGTIPVVEAADLILLKLFAGGPQDLLDVKLLLARDPRALRAKVVGRLEDLPPSLRSVWEVTAS